MIKDGIEYFETKKAKIIFFFILSIVPVGVVFVFIIGICFGSSTKQIILEKDSLETVKGVVDTLYDDVSNHNVRTAILTNKILFQIEPDWINDIEIGDSLSKDKGSFLLKVYKKSNKMTLLDYRKTFPAK